MNVSIRRFNDSDAKAFQEAVLESVEHISAWLPLFNGLSRPAKCYSIIPSDYEI